MIRPTPATNSPAPIAPRSMPPLPPVLISSPPGSSAPGVSVSGLSTQGDSWSRVISGAQSGCSFSVCSLQSPEASSPDLSTGPRSSPAPPSTGGTDAGVVTGEATVGVSFEVTGGVPVPALIPPDPPASPPTPLPAAPPAWGALTAGANTGSGCPQTRLPWSMRAQ